MRAQHVAGELTVAPGDDVDVLTGLGAGARVNGEGKTRAQRTPTTVLSREYNRIAASVQNREARAARRRPRVANPT
jgi:hypothetical protein